MKKLFTFAFWTFVFALLIAAIVSVATGGPERLPWPPGSM